MTDVQDRDDLPVDDFADREWDELGCPESDHPNRDALWAANESLGRLRTLRENPNIKNPLIQRIDFYEEDIRRFAAFLHRRDHRIAFIGSIGVGKSTAICKLANLLKPGAASLGREVVLATGAGGTTICQVHISQGTRFGLRLEPRTELNIRKDVEDFAEYLLHFTRGSTSSGANHSVRSSPGISKEIERALRNMSGLVEEKRFDENGKSSRTDPARELASKHTEVEELTNEILTKMERPRRHRRETWYSEDTGLQPMGWLQETFSKVNNGREPQFTIPEKIELLIPGLAFSKRNFEIEIIDTRGVSDAAAARQDLLQQFDDPRTLVVLCSTFCQAPDLTVQTLLRQAKEGGRQDIESKTVVLVLPHDGIAMQVKDNSGSLVENVQEGYDLKGDAVDLSLSHIGLTGMPVLFFNAKDDPSEAIRDALLAKLAELRQTYETKV